MPDHSPWVWDIAHRSNGRTAIGTARVSIKPSSASSISLYESPAALFDTMEPQLAIPADGLHLPPGEYQLEIGMYVPTTGERLPVFLSDSTEDPARRLLPTIPIKVQ